MAEISLMIALVVFRQCSDWFTSILTETGTGQIWITCFMIWISYKFLLKPVFGYASSDLARKSYNAFKRRKEE